MKRVIGIGLYYLLWPIVWLYAPLTRRVRVLLRTPSGLLLVKNVFGSGYWQLPGGGIKQGESVQVAAARELKEELGIVIDPEKILLLNEAAVICRQSGLLMRYHYVIAETPKKVFTAGFSIASTAYYSGESTKARICSEVYAGIELADKHGINLVQ
jgi:8-oxo-dGTP pyrophosphatase MutT (NUDIX family)